MGGIIGMEMDGDTADLRHHPARSTGTPQLKMGPLVLHDSDLAY